MSEISGKTIVTTGGARGVARLLAHKMASQGGMAAIYELDAGDMDATVEEVRATTGAEAYGFVCDVSNRDDVYLIADKVRETVGTADILSNNAGVVSARRLMDIADIGTDPLNDWRRSSWLRS